MPMRPPASADLESIAQRHDLGLDSQQVTDLTAAITASLASYDAVEFLYENCAPVAPTREWDEPSAEANPLNAWYMTCDVRGAQDGPLGGRRFAIKDNTSVAGVPMMNGSRILEGFTPSRDATVVSRLLDAGGTIAGKATCEDLCFSGGSHTSATGPVLNPWDNTRTAGGSSSGSAALVAAGVVDGAIGGDQGGSVRIPAAFCGIVGFKPTHGLVPYTGAFPIEQTLDHLGPMTRTVRGTAEMLDAIAGPDGRDPRQPAQIRKIRFGAALKRDSAGLRLGLVREGFGHDNSEARVDAAVRAAAETLAEAGLKVDEVSIPWHAHGSQLWDVIATDGSFRQMLEGNGYGMNWPGLYDPEVIEHFGRAWREDASRFSTTVKMVALTASHSLSQTHGKHYAMARNLVPQLTEAYDTAFEGFDLLLMPTVPMVAPPIPEPDCALDVYLDRALGMLRNTAPFDVTGHPACSVPTRHDGDLPVGMMIVGRRFEDDTVIELAHNFEQIVGGFASPPFAHDDRAPSSS
ncbi:amidase [Nocardioides endophyticus]|uniref:Amidase n=1 Tax=Nocardioides endophyticus TaxID=1353775 RepID=A0ABP8Y6G6_9ACTN